VAAGKLVIGAGLAVNGYLGYQFYKTVTGEGTSGSEDTSAPQPVYRPRPAGRSGSTGEIQVEPGGREGPHRVACQRAGGVLIDSGCRCLSTQNQNFNPWTHTCVTYR